MFHIWSAVWDFSFAAQENKKCEDVNIPCYPAIQLLSAITALLLQAVIFVSC